MLLLRLQCPLVPSARGPEMVYKYVSVSVAVCVCVYIYRMNLKYALRWHIHISVHSVLCQCVHTNTRILTPFEDSEPTGLKVDTTVGVTVDDSDLCCGAFEVIRAPINSLVC